MSVTVHVRFKDVEETFTGDVDTVWKGVNRFFGRLLPLLNAVNGVVLTVHLNEVLDASKGLVAVTEEGPVVLVSKQKLTDSETLLLMLLAAYVGSRLGVLKKSWLTRDELREWLGKSGKITGTRLGELSREGLVAKTEEGAYKLSTLGIKRLVEELLPQIKSKVQTPSFK